MGYGKREIPVSAVARAVYCGRCEKGWVEIKTGDPMYPTAFRACTCNARGMEEIGKYRDYLYSQDWFVEGEKASVARIRAARGEKLLANPKHEEIEVDSVRSLFYVPPSGRKMMGEASAKKALALSIHGDVVNSWGLADWEAFDLEHVDSVQELASRSTVGT